VSLSWSDYGRDMWYWIESCNVTLGQPFVRGQLWATGRSFVARVQLPAAPTNVLARRVTGGIQVSWNGVSYPSSAVFYWVYYWNVDAGEPVGAHRFGPFSQETRSGLFPTGPPGPLFGFHVRAENLAGLGPPSNGYYLR
jgi:hypothetical protein